MTLVNRIMLSRLNAQSRLMIRRFSTKLAISAVIGTYGKARLSHGCLFLDRTLFCILRGLRSDPQRTLFAAGRSQPLGRSGVATGCGTWGAYRQ